VNLTVHFAPCVKLSSNDSSTRVWELLSSKYPNLVHRQQAIGGGFAVDTTKGSPFSQRGVYFTHTEDGKLDPAGLDCVFTDADICDSFPDDHTRGSKEVRLTREK
jgi:hypothetical protein